MCYGRFLSTTIPCHSRWMSGTCLPKHVLWCVLGRLLMEDVPVNVPEHVPKHVPKHMPEHVPARHIPKQVPGAFLGKCLIKRL